MQNRRYGPISMRHGGRIICRPSVSNRRNRSGSPMTLSVGDSQIQSAKLIYARYCHLFNSYDPYSHWASRGFRSQMPLDHDRYHSFYTWFSCRHIWQHPRLAVSVCTDALVRYGIRSQVDWGRTCSSYCLGALSPATNVL